jgi:hypothetical protein
MTEQRIRKAVAGKRVQITEIQLAAQTRIAFKAPKIGVNRVFVPTNMLLRITGYGNSGEVSICLEGNLSSGNDDPSW